MRKRGENSIRKWKMIRRLQFVESTLNLIKPHREKVYIERLGLFMRKRRLDFDPKVDNDSQITIRRTHVI